MARIYISVGPCIVDLFVNCSNSGVYFLITAKRKDLWKSVYKMSLFSNFMFNSREMSNLFTFENKHIPRVESSMQALHLMGLALITVSF